MSIYVAQSRGYPPAFAKSSPSAPPVGLGKAMNPSCLRELDTRYPAPSAPARNPLFAALPPATWIIYLSENRYAPSSL